MRNKKEQKTLAWHEINDNKNAEIRKLFLNPRRNTFVSEVVSVSVA
jgi:hypothetical protein